MLTAQTRRGRANMRHSFPEWYRNDEATFQAILETGAIALDANVLHHLYRLGEQQRQQVLSVLGHENVRSRLWLPYQAGLEFQRNRLKNAYDQCRVYRELADEVNTHTRQLKAKFEERISDPDVRRVPVATLEEMAKSLKTELLDLARKHVIDFATVDKDDPVLAAIDALFAIPDQVGKKPTDDELKKRITESKSRYEKDIPPGYRDAKGPNKKPSPEGDYLIWSELLEYADSIEKPLLFVTNDEKEDWYFHSPDGKIRGPRPELRAEMASRTDHPYHQTTLKGFLRLVERFLSIHVDQETIKQVEATTNAHERKLDALAGHGTSYVNAVVDAIRRTCPEVQILHPPTDTVWDLYLTIDGETITPAVLRYSRHKMPIRILQKIAKQLSSIDGSTPKLIIANYQLSRSENNMLQMSNILFVTWDGQEDDEALRDAILLLL
ncbi:PIN-like domain-containing protein [Nocardia sp. NPDC051832]|uniref:PIN-like domain-containing protein n=1 Tax=Nocardia sp. NPDC051832 TaxID=3155673 RepID=UPI00344A91F5